MAKWGLYIGKRSLANFLVAIESKTWAGREKYQFEIIHKDDYLYFFQEFQFHDGIEDKQSRPSSANQLIGHFKKIMKVKIISSGHKSKNPMFGHRYPIEFKFTELMQKDKLESNSIPYEILEQIRLSMLLSKPYELSEDWDI
ncbi:MAG: hypothetical protein HeimC2_35280 [Candidatus Heimdallarchaeota archaeon LC_2]|nr:MAG: hypothetical protein HeimC2_35280 [Candidatus Heimdallarchaeota archaeon LC_2]